MALPAAVRSIVMPTLVLALDAALLALALGGVAALAHEPRALALLAIWGAGGFVLARLRPVRGQDVATSRRDPLPMILLLLVPLVTPAIGAWVARRGWLLLPGPAAAALGWTGVALAAAGLALRITAML